MSEKIIQLNEGIIKEELKELVRNSVEETLNGLLDKETAELTNAARYERTETREGYRNSPSNQSRRYFPRWELCFNVGLCPPSSCRWHTMGQQEIYEHEASG